MAKKKIYKLGWWKKDFWKTFSLYIRTRDNFTCFTCGRKGEGSGIHAGHYIPKSICGLALYFDERNVHAQCYHCNINLGGNGRIYERKMIEKYGQEIVNELDRIHNESHSNPFKIREEDYKQLIQDYKEKIKLITGSN